MQSNFLQKRNSLATYLDGSIADSTKIKTIISIEFSENGTCQSLEVASNTKTLHLFVSYNSFCFIISIAFDEKSQP